MKRFAYLTVAILVLAGALAWALDEPQEPKPTDEPADAQAEVQIGVDVQPPASDAAITDEQIDYTLGYLIGMDLKRQGLDAPVNEAFVAGLRVAMG